MGHNETKDSGIEWIGEIPAEWDVTLLGSVFHQHQHKNVGLIEQNLLSLSYGRIVRKNMKTNDGLKPGSYETYNIINADDIVCRFTDLQNDQRSLRNAISTERGIVTSAYLTIRSNDADDVDSRYVNYLLRDYDIKKVFYGLGAGVRQSLKWSEFRKLPLILPPLPEQRRIATYLDARVSRIDRLVDGLSRRVELLDEYKKSLISECVTKGIRQHENMKDSGIEWVGEIPAEWELVRIRDAVSTFRGKAQDDNEHYGDEYPSLYAASLSMNGIRQNNIKPIFLSTVEAKRYRLNFDDVLVMEGGATAGTVCQYKGMPENCMHRESVIRLNGHDGKCDNTFLRYYLTYTKNIGYVESISPAVTFMHYTLDKIDNTPLILPPLPEQREIAVFLDERVSVIDRLMDACRKQIDSLGEYKKSLISECVTGKRRITDADLEGVSVA